MIEREIVAPPEFLIDLAGKNRAELVMKLLLFGAILLFTLIVLRWIARLVIHYLLKITGRSQTAFDDRLLMTLDAPLRFLIAVAGWWVASLTLELPRSTTNTINHIGSALVAVGIFWGLFRSADVVGEAVLEFQQRGNRRANANAVRFGRQISKAVIVLLAFVAVMDRLGYNLNGVLAGLGLGGLAVALAAQEALSNLIGYFVIIADAPFAVGDYIENDAATGTVENIGFRSTRIRQQDESLVIVPNAVLVRSSITNWARLRRRRLDLSLGIARNTPPNQVLALIQTIRDMLMSHDRVLKETVFVQFVNFGGKSLDVRIICYVNEPAWEAFQRIKEDVNLRIMHILADSNVELAS
jgi:MscS family membrane protein